mmetsp:Transcript_35571/g.80271  ORF Transcript_35571/g.80271 Transcript_35571/m.80271 type:complete len:574 (-) Transcript_35571:9-1730(-)
MNVAQPASPRLPSVHTRPVLATLPPLSTLDGPHQPQEEVQESPRKQLGSRLNLTPQGQAGRAPAPRVRALADVSVRAAADHGLDGLIKPKQPGTSHSAAAPIASPRQKFVMGPLAMTEGDLPEHLGGKMVGHLNQLHAFMQQVLRSERVRHSSEVSLLMRKTGKDLQHTYAAVQDAMNMLSSQVIDLCTDMEAAQRQMSEINLKYRAVKDEAEIHNQYISELEAALDANGAGVAGTLKQYMEKVAAAQRERAQAVKESTKREADLRAEVSKLKQEVQDLKTTIVQLSKGPGTHPLPEMSPSWTRRNAGKEGTPATRSEQPVKSHGLEEVDVVGGVLMVGDARRAVPRVKLVRKLVPSQKLQVAGSSPFASKRDEVAGCSSIETFADTTLLQQSSSLQHSAEESSQLLEQLETARTRTRAAEERCNRWRGLLDFAAMSARLVQAIFNELHTNWRLQPEEEVEQEEMLPRAPLVLDKIADLYCAAVPGMGDLTGIILTLTRELAWSPMPDCLAEKPDLSSASCDSAADILSAGTSGEPPQQSELGVAETQASTVISGSDDEEGFSFRDEQQSRST